MIKKGWKSFYIQGKLIYGLFELNPFDFRIYLFPIIINHQSRHLFGFTFYRWRMIEVNNSFFVFLSRTKTVSRRCYLSISFLYMPSLDFRIGNGKTWFWIRNENIYGWIVRQKNVKNGW